MKKTDASDDVILPGLSILIAIEIIAIKPDKRLKSQRIEPRSLCADPFIAAPKPIIAKINNLTIT
jgi:hypothetical protein